MNAKRIGPGVWIAGPLGEIEADETVRQNYIRHGLPPPPPRRSPDWPQGRRLDCGHVVHYAGDVMSASRGSSCSHCYDRMSD